MKMKLKCWRNIKNASWKGRSQLTKMDPDIGYEIRDQLLKRKVAIIIHTTHPDFIMLISAFMCID